MASMPKVDVTLKIDGHVTERGAVMRERCAAMKVLDWLGFDARPQLNHTAWTAAEVVDNLFPLPKVQRRRRAADPAGSAQFSTREWCGRSIIIHRALGSSVWLDVLGGAPDSGYVIEEKRARVFLDLLNSPFEEAEGDWPDDGSAGGSL